MSGDNIYRMIHHPRRNVNEEVKMTRLELAIRRIGPVYQFAGQSKINLPRCIGIAKGRIQPNQREIERLAVALNISPGEVSDWILEEA
jgi:hypothetical protein